jgi:uncharacterized protein HemX
MTLPARSNRFVSAAAVCSQAGSLGTRTVSVSRASWALAVVLTIAAALLVLLPIWMLVENAQRYAEERQRAAAQQQRVRNERRRVEAEQQRLIEEQQRFFARPAEGP